MIKMENLKPIIEPLLTDDNSASIIESITAIDTEPNTDVDDAVKAAVAEAVSAANAEWNRRFRNTFFNGVQQGGEQDPIVPPAEESEPEVVEAPTTFEELFKTE